MRQKDKTQHLSGSNPTISWLQGVCSTGVPQPQIKENNFFLVLALSRKLLYCIKKSGENFTSHSATKNSSVEIGRETKFFFGQYQQRTITIRTVIQVTKQRPKPGRGQTRNTAILWSSLEICLKNVVVVVVDDGVKLDCCLFVFHLSAIKSQKRLKCKSSFLSFF